MIPEDSKQPKWLKKFQENSWEAELLISGGAIFSLLQINNPLLSLYHYFKVVNPFLGLDEGFLMSVIAFKGLTIGFALHLLSRAYWIALSCIHVALNKGQGVNEGFLQTQIALSNRTSSILFSASILFVIITSGTYLLMFLTLMASVYSKQNAILDFSIILIAIYWLDFFLNGWLRKIKYTGLLLRYPFWLLDRLSLGILYQHPLRMLISSVGKFKMIGLTLIFLSLTLLFSFNDFHSVLNVSSPFDQREYTQLLGNIRGNYSSYNYQSESNGVMIRPQIQSPKVKDNFLRIEIGYARHMDQFIRANSAYSFSEIFEIKIDDSTVHHVRWRGKAPEVGGDFSSIISFVEIAYLKSGEHILTINQSFNSKEEKIATEIPFWKDN